MGTDNEDIEGKEDLTAVVVAGVWETQAGGWEELSPRVMLAWGKGGKLLCLSVAPHFHS